MSDQYVAVAVDHRGRLVGTYKGATVKGLMATVDEKVPTSTTNVDIRSNFTGDGTYWGEGGGSVMASRDWRGWRVHSYAPIKQPTPGQVPWKSRFHAIDAWLAAWNAAYYHRPGSHAYKSGMEKANELWKQLEPAEQNAAMKYMTGEWTERELKTRFKGGA